MRSITRRLVGAAFAVGFLFAWGAEADRDVVGAQAPKPIMATRIYTGADGQSHAEQIELAPATVLNTTSVQFNRAPAGRFSDWHVGPRRQFVITLSGRGEVELAGGKKITMQPGHINLVEDTTGKGHTTRVVGSEDRVTISIPLADQTVTRGPLVSAPR